MRLVLASRNAHKLRELSALLAPHEVVPLPEDVQLPPEVGDTFLENALGKARAGAQLTGAPLAGTEVTAVEHTAVERTGSGILAEDSGIEAMALDGAPGVRSARYAGEDASDAENLSKLLREVPSDGDTRVAYVCVLVAIAPGGRAVWTEGRCTGRLTHDPRGEGGFGYDPAFVPDDLPGGRTMAELSAAEKGSISHRGRAARALLEHLERMEMR